MSQICREATSGLSDLAPGRERELIKAIHSPSGENRGEETLSEPRVSCTVRSSARLVRKRLEMRVSFSLSPSPLIHATERASGDSTKSLIDSWKTMSSAVHGEGLAGGLVSSA